MAEPEAPSVPGGDAAKTIGKAEQSAREAYHGGQDAPAGGQDLGRKDPQESGDADRDKENVPQR